MIQMRQRLKRTSNPPTNLSLRKKFSLASTAGRSIPSLSSGHLSVRSLNALNAVPVRAPSTLGTMETPWARTAAPLLAGRISTIQCGVCPSLARSIVRQARLGLRCLISSGGPDSTTVLSPPLGTLAPALIRKGQFRIRHCGQKL